MNKKLYLITCFIFTFFSAKLQVVYPAWAWGYNFNGKISAIEYHNDYIYTAGTFSDSSFLFGNENIINHGNKDVVIMKWDTSGNMIWATSIWGTNNDTVVSIKVNTNNELVVVGSSNSAILNTGGNTLICNGGYDIYYAKYDLNGNALNAYIYGSANNEYAIDMCTDYQSSIYIARAGNLTKYDSSGVFVWEKSITATQGNTIAKLSYSAADSTIVLCGSFAGTFTINNLSISSYLNYNNIWQSHIYLAKLAADGSSVWLNNYSQGNQSSYMPNMFVSSNGKIYITCVYFGLSAHHYFFEVLPNGVFVTQAWSGIPMPEPYMFNDITKVSSISGQDDYVSVHYHAPLGLPADMGIALYNTSSHSLEKIYHANALGVHVLRSPNTIYTSAFSMDNQSLGKIKGAALHGYPTNQTLNQCLGTVTALNGNIAGGIGTLTYSWAPATGLNNTNTNTVNFTVTNNITYTLTVTDQYGQIAKDTFNIIVESPIPPANITAQYPFLCDTMELYANNGIAGHWHYVIGNNWYSPPGQLGSYGTIQKIIQPGRYMYAAQNSCGTRKDSIDISSLLSVTATVTDDTICTGQSIIFIGNGAINYTWSGGVVNNVPFTPAYTPYAQNYVVTGTDANGCIGTSNVTVKVYQTVNTTTSTSICASQIPYVWNGQSIDSTGIYTANFTAANGCDSIATLNLTVSPCIVCVRDFTINYSPYYYALTESQSWITTSGTVLIPSGVTVKLDANSASYVRLNPGFKAEYGAVFVAQALNGCAPGAPQLPQVGKIMNTDAFSANEIVLYPNPTTGMIHIKHDEKLKNIQIFDMVGKLVINQVCEGEPETYIDLSNWPHGVYHVKATGYNSIKVVKNNE